MYCANGIIRMDFVFGVGFISVLNTTLITLFLYLVEGVMILKILWLHVDGVIVPAETYSLKSGVYIPS